LVTQQLAN